MIGTVLGHYEVFALLGKGGMGEVYRARDTKLGREVALKILPRELSGDPERAARFEREARALASLQHPNVASIYGFEESGGTRFLAMELVDGVDLAKRIAAGPLPLDEVRSIARQIASGLEAAHEAGLVHRDLKPANIMMTGDGEVKILDFGLARAWFGDPGDDGNPAASPTITAAMTQAGTILGTAAYMSPEQARGRSVDRRADIWAFGVILWEMVTGAQLFEGETISDTLAAVLRAEPDWEKLPVEEAPLLCRLIERCLARDPRQRLRDIGEARILLQEGGGQTSRLSLPAATPLPSATAPPPRARRLPPTLTALALTCLVVGALTGWLLSGEASPPRLLHTMIPPPAGTEFDLSGSAPGPAMLSPDGTMITFTAIDPEGVTHLYLRRLDREDAVVLSGTEDAAYPFWSPDSKTIGFFQPNTEQKLKKVAIAGGPPVTLCPATNGKGGTWNEDGTIVFAPSHDSALYRVPSIGGDPVAITELGADENSHRHPRFLPDGRRFLFLARPKDTTSAATVRIGSLDGGPTGEVAESEAQAEYGSDFLLTVREGVLTATPFDLEAGATVGGGRPLVEDVLVLPGAAVASYSVTADGMLLYQTGEAQTVRLLQWVSTDGDNTRRAIGDPGQIFRPSLSPDGTRAIAEILGESRQSLDLWLVDLATGLRTRFTFDEGDEYAPVWTPDGSSVIYSTSADGTYRIIRQPVEGVGGSQVLLESERFLRTSSVSPDGASLLFARDGDAGDVDICLLPLDGTSEPREVLATPQPEGGAVFSPDGRWIAYHGSSPSTWDVYVIPAGGGPRKWQVSTTGAVYPHWRADGKALLVTTFNGSIVSYDVETVGDSFRVGAATTVANVESPDPGGSVFDVDPSGERLLVGGPDPSTKAEVSLVHLVTDWRRGLVH